MNQIQIQLTISLLAAHVISDFILQTNKDIESKHQFGVLIRHCLIVALLSYLLSGFWTLWIIPVVIFISHFCLDYIKTRFFPQKLFVFVIDQLLHAGIIITIAVVIKDITNQGNYEFWQNALGGNYYIVLILLTGFFITTHVGSVLVGFGVEPYLKEQIRTDISAIDTTKTQISSARLGFDKGGKIIGQLERAMIFIFILVNQPSAIGFLIAAKSLLRFGEIGSGSSRKEMEYIIIGTFMSFLLGLISSYITRIAILSYGIP